MLLQNKYLAAVLLMLLSAPVCQAQELFIISEPASNMPAKSAAFRITDKIMQGHRHALSGSSDDVIMQRIVPELMVGLNRALMFHISMYASTNYKPALKFEGVNLYAKYRFLSVDDVHKHFRMAAFSRVSVIDNPVNYREINLEGDNSGINTGIVATQLLHKLALSATIGHIYALDNIAHKRPEFVPEHALNYVISCGYLLLPFHYKSYNQPNLNVYLELQGKNNFSEYEANTYDVFPALQLILKSYMRIDFGYRYQLKSTIPRNAYSGFLLRFEYNMFNAL